MLPSVRINLFLYSIKCDSADVLHFRHDIGFKVDTMGRVVYNLFQIFKRKLITVFVTSILRTILLDRIIGQMDEVIIKIGVTHRVRLA